MRLFAAAVLLALLHASSGCFATFYVEGTLGEYTPRLTLSAAAQAWLVQRGQDDVQLLVRFEDTMFQAPANFPVGEALFWSEGPLVARYEVPDDGDDLHVASFAPVADFVPPKEAEAIPIATALEPGAAPPTGTALIAPDRLVLSGRARRIDLVASRRNIPATFAQFALLPVTLAVDLALTPVYVIGIGAFVAWEKLRRR